MGNWAYNPCKWNYFTILITGRGPPCNNSGGDEPASILAGMVDLNISFVELWWENHKTWQTCGEKWPHEQEEM